MPIIFSTQALKAQVGALIAFLGPILTYLQVAGEWSWRAFGIAVVSGLIAGLTIFYTRNANAPPEPVQQLRDRHKHEAPEAEEGS